MKNKWWWILGIPVLYGFVLRIIFGFESFNEIFEIMSISFIFCLPIIMGFLTVYLSPEHKKQNLSYRLLAPWIPIFIFFLLTILVSLEGWACWIMILPLCLVGASLGGWLAGWYDRYKKKNNLSLSFIVLLPFLISPIEKMIGSIPGEYKAYTYIDINAPKEKIWDNVVRVRTIEAENDKGWLTKFLGIPRPLDAILNYEGVGAYREARFTKGLVFHETVKEYEHQKKMVFSIKAEPHEIPSTTMDEHIVIGGSFFDVLDGTYELEQLGNNHYRLHLYSYFKMNTTFNFYASVWAKWIMKDIQNNILQIEKHRSES